MANSYVNFGASEYPSVDVAVRRSMGGLEALASMQAASVANQRQYSMDRLAMSERMRMAELDAQKFSLEVARERRAQDNASANMLMTLTRFQQERTLTDLKIVQAQTESARAVREEADKIRLTSEGDRPLARVFTPNAGVSALAISQLHQDGRISLLGPKEQERIDAISANLQTQQVYVGEMVFDPLTWAGKLDSDDDETRISAQAYFMKSGVPEEQLRAKQRPGDSVTARSLLGTVSINSDSLASSMSAFSVSQGQLDRWNRSLSELKQDPIGNKEAIDKLSERIVSAEQDQAKVRRTLEKAKMLGPDGQLLTFDQIHTPTVRARAAVTEYAARLRDPTVAAQLFAPREEALRQIEAADATPEQKEAARVLLEALPEPQKTAAALQAMELGAIEVEKYGPLDPRGQKGIAMIAEAVSVGLAPVTHAMYGGGFSAADVAGVWNVKTALGASEAARQNRNAELGLGRPLVASEMMVAAPGAGKAITYSEALESLNGLLAKGAGTKLSASELRDMEALLKQLDGSTVEVSGQSGPQRVESSSVVGSVAGQSAVAGMLLPAFQQAVVDNATTRVPAATVFSIGGAHVPTLQSAPGGLAAKYLVDQARRIDQSSVDTAFAKEVVALQKVEGLAQRKAPAVPPNLTAMARSRERSIGSTQPVVAVNSYASTPPTVPIGWIPGANDLAEAEVLKYQVARLGTAIESNDRTEVALAYADIAAATKYMRSLGPQYSRFSPALALRAAGLSDRVAAHSKLWDSGGWLKTVPAGTSAEWTSRQDAVADIDEFFKIINVGSAEEPVLSPGTRVVMRELDTPAPTAAAPGAPVIE